MRRFILLFLLFLLLLLKLPLATAAVEVRVGIDNNSPLTFFDDAGQVGGLSPELLQQVAKENNWQLQYHPCEVAGLSQPA